MNILLLGETGAGKSTFINGLATYFAFESLEAAEHGFEPLVPIKFASSGGLVELNTKYNNNANENKQAGASATQQPTSYVLGWNGQIINLLDTPGIGDTRGVEQDEKNNTMILQHIKSYPMIHGICILVKNNQTRLTAYFRNCIKQILAHLHADAVHNIVFVVTHGRVNNFDAEECQNVLQTMVNEYLSGIGIELDANKIYCVDNEPVRYLAQYKLKIPFTKPDERHKEAQRERSFRAGAEESWESSYETINKLLDHFYSLTPHDTSKTYNLNQAREVCLALGEPLATSTSELLQKQISIQEKKDEITQLLEEGLSLENALSTEVQQLRYVYDGKFYITCTSKSCSKIVDDNGRLIKIPRYCSSETLQHSSNSLISGFLNFANITTNVVSLGALNLVSKCPECGCGAWHHSATDHEIIQETIDVVNPKIRNMIKDSKSKAEVQKEILANAQLKIQNLEIEISFLREAQLQALQFLKQNSMLDCLDVYLERLQMLRDEERQRQGSNEAGRGGGGRVSFKIEQLDKAIDVYLKEKETLNTTINNNNGNNNKVITLEMIQDVLHGLYSLERHGQQIKATVEKKLMGHMKFKQIVHTGSLSRWNLNYVIDGNDGK